LMGEGGNVNDMKSRLIKGSALARKGKDPIAPDRVEVMTVGGTMVLVFYFPKSDAIGVDDKEVNFSSRVGGMEIRGKFPLKPMVFNGKLEI